MKVVFDTNVLVDLWAGTEDFAASFESVDITLLQGFDACFSMSSAPSIAYLLSARKLMSRARANEALSSLLDVLDALDVTSADCKAALANGGGDFEDDLIAWSAKRHGADFIVTRNKWAFRKSPVPALTPQEFADLYRPANVTYEETTLSS